MSMIELEKEVARSLGTVLQVGKTDPVTVIGMTSIDGVEINADTIDVTTLDCVDGYRRYIQGLKDGGEVTLEGKFLPQTGYGQNVLKDLIDSGEVEDFAIVFPEELGATWTFRGLVTRFGTSAEMEEDLAVSVTIKISGKPELVLTE